MKTRTVMIFSRFERFWHWTQVALILTLMFSGLAVHGVHDLLPFGQAVLVHTWAALALLGLWLFATFWLFTSGTWRHFLPTKDGLWRVVRFYAYGIFKGEHHPYHKAYWRKHNPLQALAYLSLKMALFPAIWISGLAYLSYGFWPADNTDWLATVALIHTAAAYAIGLFVIVHVYMLTTGHSFAEHVKPMLTGYDEVELTEAEEAFLKESPGAVLK